MKKILALAIAILLVAPAAWAANYSFDVAWISPATVDAGRSASNTLGFDDWYVWKYKITVIDEYPDGSPVTTEGKALSNWVLELPNCYIESPEVFQEIAASAGWGGGDKVRVYDADVVDTDPNSGLSGLKWEFSKINGDELDTPGEYDYFWFSAPTDLDIETDWSIKAGNTILASGKTRGPDCPGCPEPPIPEPMSIVLMGTGIFGLVIRNRKRG